jgi:hypothetical protein
MSNNSNIKNKRGPGSPQSISNEELEDMLIKFVAENSLNKLNYLQLEKKTGVHRHIWRRRMDKQIKELKSSLQLDLGGSGTKEYVQFPNISNVVETHWNNKQQMIASFKMYEDTIMRFYNDALAYHKHKHEVAKLKSQLKEIKEELKIARSEKNYYKNEVRELSILSKNITERKERNLKNVLDIKEKSNKNKALSTDFESNFPNLFEE